MLDKLVNLVKRTLGGSPRPCPPGLQGGSSDDDESGKGVQSDEKEEESEEGSEDEDRDDGGSSGLRSDDDDESGSGFQSDEREKSEEESEEGSEDEGRDDGGLLSLQSDDEDSEEEDWYEEEVWYDIYVRLPWGEDSAKTDVAVPLPDRSDTLSYRRPADPPDGTPFCRLVIGSYAKDTDPTVVSSGLVVWEASAQLCRYLLKDPDLGRAARVLELGSGTGGPGLLAHRLRRKTPAPPPAYRRIGAAWPPEPPGPPLTMLTDGDVNSLANLRQNVWVNTSPEDDDSIAVRQLIWGEDTADVFREDHGEFDYVFGSDLLYSNRLAIRHLFETVDKLMTEGGKFVLAHSVRYGVRLETTLQSAKFHRLLYEIVGWSGEICVVVYRRMSMSSAGPLLDRIRFQMDEMRAENDALRLVKADHENRAHCLGKRIVELGGDEVPFDIFGLDENIFNIVLTFLGTSDLATLATLGLKTIRDEAALEPERA